MDSRERRLLNDFQRDFPLCEAPYATLAKTLHATEEWVLATLRRFVDETLVSRVGAIFRPGSVGASTLAAMAVPEARLADVARSVSAHEGVNHNYKREHRFNLWFVAHAQDAPHLRALLARIERETVLPVLALPLAREFHIDLGFDLDRPESKTATAARDVVRSVAQLEEGAQRIVAALQHGLPLTPRPYVAIAERAGLARAEGERRVLRQLEAWLHDGTIKRLGVIVRHRPLGFIANAMAVWDVPNDDVDAAGCALAVAPGVTLCYRRERALPAWPYNLYCMVHGRRRELVDAALDAISAQTGLGSYPHARLFSRDAFKQHGAVSFDSVTLDG
jgi:DNA-binding Lrp family transcriptional regulator